MHRLGGKVIPNSNPPVRFKLNHNSTRLQQGEVDTSIWVGDLSPDVDDFALYQFFSQRYQTVRCAKVTFWSFLWLKTMLSTFIVGRSRWVWVLQRLRIRSIRLWIRSAACTYQHDRRIWSGLQAHQSEHGQSEKQSRGRKLFRPRSWLGCSRWSPKWICGLVGRSVGWSHGRCQWSQCIGWSRWCPRQWRIWMARRSVAAHGCLEPASSCSRGGGHAHSGCHPSRLLHLSALLLAICSTIFTTATTICRCLVRRRLATTAALKKAIGCECDGSLRPMQPPS